MFRSRSKTAAESLVPRPWWADTLRLTYTGRASTNTGAEALLPFDVSKPIFGLPTDNGTRSYGLKGDYSNNGSSGVRPEDLGKVTMLDETKLPPHLWKTLSVTKNTHHNYYPVIGWSVGNKRYGPTDNAYYDSTLEKWIPYCYVQLPVYYYYPVRVSFHLAAAPTTFRTMSHLPVTVQMRSSALNSALPGAKSEISLPNFIWELKDFSNYLKLLSKVKEGIGKQGLDKTLTSEYRQWCKGLGLAYDKNSRLQVINRVRVSLPRPARIFADSIADNILQWNFAIAPLISDLGIMSLLSQAVDKRVKDALKASQKPIRVRGSASDTATSEVTYSHFGFQFLGRKTTTTKLTVWTRVKPKVLSHPTLHAIWGATGLAIQPSTVWNAIPLSFLADNITNLGDIVSSFDTNVSLLENTECLGECISSDCVIELFARKDGNSPYVSIGTKQMLKFDRSQGSSSWLLNPPNLPPRFKWKDPGFKYIDTWTSLAWKIFK